MTFESYVNHFLLIRSKEHAMRQMFDYNPITSMLSTRKSISKRRTTSHGLLILRVSTPPPLIHGQQFGKHYALSTRWDLITFFSILHPESACYPIICWPDGQGCPGGTIPCPHSCPPQNHCCWYETDLCLLLNRSLTSLINPNTIYSTHLYLFLTLVIDKT